jgi:hypothetical protein
MTLKHIDLYYKINNQTSPILKYLNFLHIPIDSFILEGCIWYYDYKPNPTLVDTVWTKIDDYKKYLEFQKWFSKIAASKGAIPIELEMILWNIAKVKISLVASIHP